MHEGTKRYASTGIFSTRPTLLSNEHSQHEFSSGRVTVTVQKQKENQTKHYRVNPKFDLNYTDVSQYRRTAQYRTQV
jgi:hypothetical protein